MGLSCEEASEGLCFSGKRWWQPPGPREGRGGCLSLSPRSSGRLSPPCAGVEPLPARPPVCWPLSPCSPPVCSPTPGQLLLPRQALTRPAQPAATPDAVFTLTTPLRGPAGSSPGLCSCCAPPPQHVCSPSRAAGRASTDHSGRCCAPPASSTFLLVLLPQPSLVLPSGRLWNECISPGQTRGLWESRFQQECSELG